MKSYKTIGGETVETEKFYTVGWYQGVDGAVFTADMTEEEVPLFYVEPQYKTQLAAELLGLTMEELSAALKLYAQYQGFKKNGLQGFIDAVEGE